MGGEMRRGAMWRRYDGADFPILGTKPMVYLNHPLKTSIFRATVATLVFSMGLIGVASAQSFSFPEGSDNPYRMFTGQLIDLHFRQIMDDGKILIVNLAKGRLGEDSANVLGALLVTTLGLAAFSRADMEESRRSDYIIVIDEFQSFATLSVANVVSELRKYHVGLVLAHQHLFQLEPEVKHAVLGNVGTLVSFRLGPEDAQMISRELEPIFAPLDLMNLPNHDTYLKLMIDGLPSKPFSATTLHPKNLEPREPPEA
jgi:hypothetical protein